MPQEITLREFIDVIIKRKWIIITVFFVSFVVAAIISLQMPRIYEVSMILESNSNLDLSKNIKAKIRQKAFDSKVINLLNLDPKGVNVNFKVSQSPNSDLIRISLRQEEGKTKSEVETLNALFIVLSDTYKEVIDYKKNLAEEEISIFPNSIKAEENAIKLEEEKLKRIEKKEKDLLARVKKIRDSSENLIAKRDILLEGKSRVKDIRALLPVYSSAIEQNIAYINHLNTQLIVLKEAKEKMIAKIKNLKTKIDSLQLKKAELILKKDNISNIRLFQKPEVSSLPIGPKKRQNITLAGTLGLMLGTLLAFFMEYWHKSNKQN